MHHFADDTNPLNFNNKQVNYNLKNLSNWLEANKTSLNVGKTELVLFTSSKKQLDFDLKIKLNGKRLYETDSVKYLGVQVDKRLTWKQHIDHAALKLNKANAMLSKLRHVLDIKTLRSVYYAIFEPHLCYASLVWAQNANSVKRLYSLQKNPSDYCSFKVEFPIQVLYLKCSKFLSPSIRQVLKTAFLLANL